MNPEFSALMALVTLLADPEATKTRLAELQATIAAADTHKAEAEAAHADLDMQREQLAAAEAKVRAREVAVSLTENRIADDLAKIETHNREQRRARLVDVAPGLTRERDDTPLAPDPIGDDHADPMRLQPPGMTFAVTKPARGATRRNVR